jgi:signal transduction histidine kinase/CheY-like chemotaxis protein
MQDETRTACMNPEIEIRIVVAIAAVLVMSSLVLCISAMRHDAHRRERHGFAWLLMTNLAFLTGTLGLLVHAVMPFWLSATFVLAGAHLGILFGYFAICAGLGERPPVGRYAGAAFFAVSAQAVVANVLGSVDVLVVTSSMINGVLALHLARRIGPMVNKFVPEIAALASLPFVAIGAAYLFRLPLLTLGASATMVTIATLVITFLLSFSALQWVFALIAIRAARLNHRLEEERLNAEEANRLKSRFLANMSHELRTPLNGVLGMAQVLQEQVDGPEHQRMVETIRTSGEGLMTILNDILDLAKIEAGKMVLEQAAFQPSEVFARIVRLHGPQAEQKGLRFSLCCDPRLDGIFMGDSHRLTQVLHNLTSNAVKFTEAGHVELRAALVEDEVFICISDSGIGMTAEQVKTAFDEFTQADVSITRRFGGTGLGMPIVKRLVDMMDGQIAISSTPGHGTCVTVTLPLYTADTAAMEGNAVVPETGRDLTGLRILVAEDNMINQKVLTALLRGTAVELTLVKNGKEALEAAMAREFDLFLFDISMPEMDGPTALNQIKAAYHVAGRKVPPAAAITANVMPEQLASYQADGFASCLAKPLRKQALIACITTLVDVDTSAKLEVG